MRTARRVDIPDDPQRRHAGVQAKAFFHEDVEGPRGTRLDRPLGRPEHRDGAAGDGRYRGDAFANVGSESLGAQDERLLVNVAVRSDFVSGTTDGFNKA